MRSRRCLLRIFLRAGTDDIAGDWIVCGMRRHRKKDASKGMCAPDIGAAGQTESDRKTRCTIALVHVR